MLPNSTIDKESYQFINFYFWGLQNPGLGWFIQAMSGPDQVLHGG